MLLCDQAIREGGTNKVTLVGIFDRIWNTQFPFQWTRPTAIYARVTDAEGEYDIRLELVRLDDEQTIGRFEGRATLAGRMESSELIFPIDTLAFERPGRYEFRLFANRRQVGGMALSVVQEVEVLGGQHGRSKSFIST
ncbi:MAG TPA: hypothetical protein VGA81_13305 [Methylomirabilota bacterium]